MSSVATIRLNAQQQEEMHTMGFKNGSQYLQWKISNVSPEEAALQMESLSGFQIENRIASSNIEDAIRLTKAEAETERLKAKLKELESNSSESLGKLDSVVNDRLQQLLKDREHLQLKHDKEILSLEASAKNAEIESLKSELDSFKSKMKNIELVKQFAPIVQPVLGQLAKGFIGMAQNGGGLMGFAKALDSLGSSQELQISAEDESALELGKNMQSMFTENELQQVLFTVAIMGREKKLITQIPHIINKLTSKSDTPTPNTTPAAENNSINGDDDQELKEFDDLEDQEEFN